MEPSPQGEEKLKERPDSEWNEENYHLRTRYHPANPATCETKMLEWFLPLKSHQQKVYADLIKEEARFQSQQVKLGSFGRVIFQFIVKKDSGKVVESFSVDG